MGRLRFLSSVEFPVFVGSVETAAAPNCSVQSEQAPSLLMDLIEFGLFVLIVCEIIINQFCEPRGDGTGPVPAPHPPKGEPALGSINL